MDKCEKFISKAKTAYGGWYDYTNVEYIDSKTPVKLKCNKHNNIFYQVPSEHIRGKRGCTLCNPRTKMTNDAFIEKSKVIHGDKYNYTSTKYDGMNTNVTIGCNIHGNFEQKPSNHLNGMGCRRCAHENKKFDRDIFIEKSKIIHGNKYDYSNVEYKDNRTYVKIICPKHGEFEQFPYSHMRGKGCSLCGTEKTKKVLTFTNQQFIKNANKTHKNKYDYRLVEYIKSHSKIKIICPYHGEFEQMAYTHLSGHGCEKCTSSVSALETEINSFLFDLGVETITSSRSIIPPNQLDIFIPSHKLAIEFDGLYWHNEQHVSSDYHLTKTKLCEQKEIKLIHIFEDEWVYKQDIVKSRLKNILGLTENKIYARKCEIKEVSSDESSKFLNNNHLQGNINSAIKIGLYKDNKLVSIMTFGNGRIIMNGNKNTHELLRFCNKLNTVVIGGANKLLNYYIKCYKPKEIISYADKRWSTGELYEKLGFEYIHDSIPNYWYVIGKNRKHRFKFRKDILVKDGYDSNKTEHEIMLERGIYRIYDCGTKKYSLLL